MEFTNHIVDPIWGLIPITEIEERLLNTKAFNRLRNIKQMGLAFLDFPGLNHTRFEHSVGVLYVADRLFQILEKTRKIFNHPQINLLFNNNSRQAVRLAALMHDLGHPPFSHAVELTFIKYPSLLGTDPKAANGIFEKYSHEKFTEYVIRKDAKINDILKGSELGYGIGEISKLAVGRARRTLSAFNQLISSDFDADKIDYLIRDNHNSGLKLGLSPDELHGSLHIQLHLSDNMICYEIYVDKRAVSFVNTLLTARHNLMRRVHLAPLGRTATQMLIGSLFKVLNGLGGEDLRELLFKIHRDCNDLSFFEAAKRRENIIGGSETSSLFDMIFDKKVWSEYAHLDYHKMHPCLRLLSDIAARHQYTDLSDHIFENPDEANKSIWVEPSVRPAPNFSLLVDWACNPVNPGFDYFAGSENEPARAILSQSLSSLDIYGYNVETRNHARRQNQTGDVSSRYINNLNGNERVLAKCVIKIVDSIKKSYKEKPKSELSVIPSEFILSILYYLEQNISSNFKNATNIYVYRGEEFINCFLHKLAQKTDCFPNKLIINPDCIDSNKIFKVIAKLETFGLIERRRVPILHKKKARDERIIRRTRFETFGFRKEFRISPWGKHYVKEEISPELNHEISNLIKLKQGQEDVQEELSNIGKAAWKLCECHDDTAFLEKIESFDETLEKSANVISERGACVMTFCMGT